MSGYTPIGGDDDADADTDTGDGAAGSDASGVVDDINDRIPEQPSMADPDSHDSTAADTADAIRDNLVGAVAGLSLGVTRLIPFSERFWRGLYKAGLKGIKKKSGCDYVGFIQVGGEIKPVPVDWDHDSQRFENRHGDFWKGPSEGEYRYRMAGNVPVVWASATSNHVGSHLQAEVAEALDLGHDLNIYESANVRVESATLNAGEVDDGAAENGAATDGGLTQFQVSGVQPGPFRDQVVPLTSEGEADARVVSLDKYYQTYPEVTDTEEMKMQEKRGEIAQQAGDAASLALKMMLVALGMVALIELGPPLISALFGGGGGGGGGGSMIPLLLSGLGVV